jgi:ketosteroid isomerase-like protein
MSKANADVVRRLYDLLNRGDIQGVIELCADDFQMDMTQRVFNPDTYEGPDGLRRFYKGVTDAWESYRWDVEETRTTGDTVVAMLHCEGQSREGGPSVDWRVGWLWKLRESRPVFVRFYRRREKALEAAGLSE